MENPSLRVNRHGGSSSRTFALKNYAENERAQWTIDTVTGEQGYIDDVRSFFFGHGTKTSRLGSPGRLKVAK